jgi:quercetin dioxygenase-like cupin family protein
MVTRGDRIGEERGKMTKKRGAAAAAVLGAVLVISVFVLPSAAQQPPPPIATEFLSGRAEFTDDIRLKLRIKFDGKSGHKKWGLREHVNVRDPSRTVVARITVQPGAQFPWHSHPGPVVVNVTEGELVYVAAEDCKERAYPAGTAFIDPGQGHVHTAFNRTGAPTVLVATFFSAPAEGPLLIPADAPEDCD